MRVQPYGKVGEIKLHTNEEIIIWKFYSEQEEIFITDKRVLIVCGDLIIKQYSFDNEKIIDSLFCNFSSDYITEEDINSMILKAYSNIYDGEYIQENLKKLSENTLEDYNSRALIIFTTEQAHVYFPSGRKYIVAIPFRLKRVCGFQFGLILERNIDHLMLNEDKNDFNNENNDNESGDAEGENKEINNEKNDNEKNKNIKNAKIHRLFSLIDPLDSLGLILISNTLDPSFELVSLPPSEDSNLVVFKSKKLNLLSVYFSQRLLKNDDILNTSNANTFNSKPLSNRRSSVLSTINDDLNNDSNVSSIIVRSEFSRNNEFSDGVEFSNLVEENETRKDYYFHFIESFYFDLSEKYNVFTISSNRKFYQELLCHFSNNCLTVLFFNKADGKLLDFSGGIKKIVKYAIQFTYFDDPVHLLLLNSDNSLSIFDPLLRVTSNKIRLPNNHLIESLYHSSSDLIDIRHSKFYARYKIINSPSNSFIKYLMKLLSTLVLPEKLAKIFLFSWGDSYNFDKINNDWDAFSIAVLSLWLDGSHRTYFHNKDNNTSFISPSILRISKGLKMGNDTLNINLNEKLNTFFPIIKKIQKKYSYSFDLPKIRTAIIIIFHLVIENCKLEVSCNYDQEMLRELLKYLLKISIIDKPWKKFYLKKEEKKKDIKEALKIECLLIGFPPPSIFIYLCKMLDKNFFENSDEPNAASLFINRSFYQFFNSQDENEIAKFFENLFLIIELFKNLAKSNSNNYKEILQLLLSKSITRSVVHKYPIGIYVPLLEVLSELSENADFSYSVSALNLLERKDLVYFILQKPPILPNLSSDEVSSYKELEYSQLKNADDFKYIKKNVFSMETDKEEISHLIFSEDKRLEEAKNLLISSKVQTTFLSNSNEYTEHNLLLIQQEMSKVIAIRTLALPCGRAALFYSSRVPLETDKFSIPPINFNTLIKPAMTTIQMDKSQLPDDNVAWGYFHNGTASGLSISRDCKNISGNWIVFNRPPELSATHAGFIFGLGLNGHLRTLEEWHIYNYLGPKHTLTSIGLLLGLSVSFLGTMSYRITKVLSVHLVALLPIGSSDLNISVPVQTAGLMGIGLVYYNSQHRKMGEVLISELESQEGHLNIIRDESYRLTAGFALGLIFIGKGNKLQSLNDFNIIEKLTSIAVSKLDYFDNQTFDKILPGTICALALIFMKTNNRNIASKIAVPKNKNEAIYIRPDLIMLRTLAQHLINWDYIISSKEWIESEVAPHFPDGTFDDKFEELDSDHCQAYYALGGICFAIALKHASCCDNSIRDILLHYLDIFMKLTDCIPTSFDQKLAQKAARNVQNILCISVALVMAGTGDISVFQRLRVLHGKVSQQVSYGSYLATHQALGYLFLGGGQYAFGTSKLSIALLIISNYPVFPTDISDIRSHLQAFRHLWAIAAEHRCLVIRDVDTYKPLQIPIILQLKNEKEKRLVTPCLLPDLKDVILIATESDNHFKVELNIKKMPKIFEVLRKFLTIYVSKRVNYSNSKDNFSQFIKGKLNEDETLHKKAKEILAGKVISHYDEDEICSMFLKTPKELLSTAFFDSDLKRELNNMVSNPRTEDDLWNLRIIFNFSDNYSGTLRHIDRDFVEKLKLSVWKMVNSEA